MGTFLWYPQCLAQCWEHNRWLMNAFYYLKNNFFFKKPFFILKKQCYLEKIRILYIEAGGWFLKSEILKAFYDS